MIDAYEAPSGMEAFDFARWMSYGSMSLLKYFAGKLLIVEGLDIYLHVEGMGHTNCDAESFLQFKARICGCLEEVQTMTGLISKT